MTIKIMARKKGKVQSRCRRTFAGPAEGFVLVRSDVLPMREAAEKMAREAARSGLYDRVRIVEIPGPEDNKPYTKKETIILA